MTEHEAKEKTEAEAKALHSLFVDELGVDEDLAEILMECGFSSIEEIAYVPQQELLSIEGFDEDIVKELRQRAKDVLLARAIAEEEQAVTHPAEDLVSLEGMTNELAYVLAKHGIITREDLAELAVDDLTEVVNIESNEAARLIMNARAHWFE